MDEVEKFIIIPVSKETQQNINYCNYFIFLSKEHFLLSLNSFQGRRYLAPDGFEKAATKIQVFFFIEDLKAVKLSSFFH